MRTNSMLSMALGLFALAPGTVAQERTGAAPQEAEKQEPKNQDPETQEPEESVEELNPFTQPGGGGNGQDEMAELFIKVDKRLQRVSELLFEASTGDASRADEIGSSGIDELIRAAESASGAGSAGIAQLLEATKLQSQQAGTEIERILEIAAENQSNSSGQPSQSPKSEGENPQQGQTPSGSRKEEKGEGPPQGEPGSETQEGEPQKNGETPNGGQEQEGSEDGPGKVPPGSETGAARDGSGNEEWGDLPVHLRKVFQNGVSDDVPPRYRDWVDAYYKRLNRRGGR